MTDRVHLLRMLLEFGLPIDTLRQQLAAFGWHSEQEFVTIEPYHVWGVLERYRRGELRASDVEDWANAIEGREDVSYDSLAESLLRDAVYELANPGLTRPLSVGVASEWIDTLRHGTSA